MIISGGESAVSLAMAFATNAMMSNMVPPVLEFPPEFKACLRDRSKPRCEFHLLP